MSIENKVRKHKRCWWGSGGGGQWKSGKTGLPLGGRNQAEEGREMPAWWRGWVGSRAGFLLRMRFDLPLVHPVEEDQWACEWCLFSGKVWAGDQQQQESIAYSIHNSWSDSSKCDCPGVAYGAREYITEDKTLMNAHVQRTSEGSEATVEVRRSTRKSYRGQWKRIPLKFFFLILSQLWHTVKWWKTILSIWQLEGHC